MQGGGRWRSIISPRMSNDQCPVINVQPILGPMLDALVLQPVQTWTLDSEHSTLEIDYRLPTLSRSSSSQLTTTTSREADRFDAIITNRWPSGVTSYP